MIYSASSVTSLTSSSLGNDPAYYVKRQLKGIAIGVVLAVALARLDYRVLTKHLLRYVWLATVILLLLIFTPFAGSDAYGASRWISIAGFTLQPIGFAKITIILTAANLAARYFEDRSIDFTTSSDSSSWAWAAARSHPPATGQGIHDHRLRHAPHHGLPCGIDSASS